MTGKNCQLSTSLRDERVSGGRETGVFSSRFFC